MNAVAYNSEEVSVARTDRTWKGKGMLKIGDFARLGQVSVETLRHYDTLGLLKPAEVDPLTGYRYYAHHQLGRLNRILALKDLGLSLEQIAPMLEGEISAEQLKGMLKLKRAEIEIRIGAEHETLSRVEARLRQIEDEAGVPPTDVVLKSVRPLLVASIRRVLPSYHQLLPLFEEMMVYLTPFQLIQWRALTIWHDPQYRPADVDVEAAITLNTAVPSTDAIRVYELPAGSMASIVHNGAFDQLPNAYRALEAWVAANGYRVCGGKRELYHYAQDPLRSDDDSYVTEIQFPVVKA